MAPGILGALLAVIPQTSLAQTASGPSGDARILVDVNLGAADSLAHDRTFRSQFLTFSEVGSTFATYSEPSPSASFGVGGSFMLTRWFGVGVAYSHTTYEDVAGLEGDDSPSHVLRRFGDRQRRDGRAETPGRSD